MSRQPAEVTVLLHSALGGLTLSALCRSGPHTSRMSKYLDRSREGNKVDDRTGRHVLGGAAKDAVSSLERSSGVTSLLSAAS